MKKALKVACVVLTLILLTLSLASCKNISDTLEGAVKVATSDSSIVSMVKNGEFDDYPGKTIGTKFSDFFSNAYWSEFEATNGMQIVEFKGDCLYLDDEIQVTIQFSISDDEQSFAVYTIGFNDIPQNALMSNALLEKVMNS